ncbi:unnamed protein product [Haemonchus placei]|uniref:Uncharacterized protein n=1 Tax=Haemonchus placei TaxID=6290 RepID=A0A3P7UKV8_HAEPC|nr:unnamed protein product [Haemonchus placei]
MKYMYQSKDFKKVEKKVGIQKIDAHKRLRSGIHLIEHHTTGFQRGSHDHLTDTFDMLPS